MLTGTAPAPPVTLIRSKQQCTARKRGKLQDWLRYEQHKFEPEMKNSRCSVHLMSGVSENTSGMEEIEKSAAARGRP